MKDLLHTFNRMRRGYTYRDSHNQEGSMRVIRKVKKLLIIGVVLFIVAVVAFIVITAAAINWIFSKAGDTSQKVQETAQHLDVPAGNIGSIDEGSIEPLSLASYVNNGAVATDQLMQTYENIPSQLQGLWLDQFKAQLDALQNQAGISDEAIQSLTNIYNTLQQ